MRITNYLLAAACALPCLGADIQVPFEKYKLKNGLRVLLSQDTSVPVVTLYVLYGVGARSEEKGRTGFAHLFEHMMFQGSANAPKGVHFKTVEANGGNLNGSTHPDYTDYYETLPSNKLAVGLWLESDRMRSLAITKENLDNQKEAVKQERRLSFDNRPYNTAIVDKWPLIAFQNWQSSHSLIGSFEDLNAASVDDVSRFFKIYYAPNNAVLAIVGDFQAADAKKWIEAYFGDIPAQDQPKHPDMTEPPITQPRHEVVKDSLARVPAVIAGYQGPARRSPEFYALSMADALLTGGDSSRLQQNLVKGKQSVIQYEANPGWPFASTSDYKEPGLYGVFALHNPAFKGNQILDQLQEEFNKLAAQPVEMKELNRARTFLRASRIKELQGTMARARLLAQYELFDGNPTLISSEMDQLLAVTPQQIQAVVKKYLDGNKRVSMEIVPAPAKGGKGASKMRRILTGVLFAACLHGQAIDRTKAPETPPLPPFKIPAMTESKLGNGLTVVTLQDNRFPLVTVRLAFPTGSRFDPKDRPGLAEAVATLLTEGTKSRVSRQIAEEVNEIGGSLNASASADSLILAGSALSESTEKLIDLVADVARNATFPADEVALYRQNRKQQLLEQRSQSEFLADEKVEEIIFGDHPYSRQNPTAPAIDALDTAVLTGFRDRLLAPNHAVLILFGKLPPRAALMKMLEAKFGGWAQRDVPAPPSGPVPAPKRSITLVDRPGSVQADVQVGHLGVTRTDPAYFPLTVGNAILGGGTASRLFNGIREKKGYAYSVYSHNQAQKDAALFSAAMQVRNEVVGDAIAELLAELKKMANEPVTGQELSSVKNYLSGNFVIRMQSQDALATQIVTVKSMGLPKDYLEMYTQRIRSAEPDQILNAAKRVMDPETSALVVVGDAKQIKSKLDKLGTVDVVPAK